jgi:hypothetical protein
VVLKCAKHDLPCVVAAHAKYGLQVEVFVCEVIWRVNNSRKPTIFYDVLYHLNVVFLQHVFEALKSIFSNTKTMRTKCAKTHSISAAQIKELKEKFLMV